MGSPPTLRSAADGEVIGVITEQLVRAEVAHHGITRLEVVPTMHERKARLSRAGRRVRGAAGRLRHGRRVRRGADLEPARPDRQAGRAPRRRRLLGAHCSTGCARVREPPASSATRTACWPSGRHTSTTPSPWPRSPCPMSVTSGSTATSRRCRRTSLTVQLITSAAPSIIDVSPRPRPSPGRRARRERVVHVVGCDDKPYSPAPHFDVTSPVNAV